MQKAKTLVLLTAIILLAGSVGFEFAQKVYAQAELAIDFGLEEGIIIVIGTLGGVTSAYLGSRVAKNKEGDKYKFDIGKFTDRIVIAVLTSVGLAISASADVLVLNWFTTYMIFTASLGTSELVLELRAKTK